MMNIELAAQKAWDERCGQSVGNRKMAINFELDFKSGWLAALSQPQGEPVAWQYRFQDMVYWDNTTQDMYLEYMLLGYEVRKLFTAPPAPAQPVRISDDDIINIANETHISMPADCDDQKEMLAIVHAVLDAQQEQPVSPVLLSDSQILEIAEKFDLEPGSEVVVVCGSELASFARAILAAKEAK